MFNPNYLNESINLLKEDRDYDYMTHGLYNEGEVYNGYLIDKLGIYPIDGGEGQSWYNICPLNYFIKSVTGKKVPIAYSCKRANGSSITFATKEEAKDFIDNYILKDKGVEKWSNGYLYYTLKESFTEVSDDLNDDLDEDFVYDPSQILSSEEKDDINDSIRQYDKECDDVPFNSLAWKLGHRSKRNAEDKLTNSARQECYRDYVKPIQDKNLNESPDNTDWQNFFNIAKHSCYFYCGYHPYYRSLHCKENDRIFFEFDPYPIIKYDEYGYLQIESYPMSLEELGLNSTNIKFEVSKYTHKPVTMITRKDLIDIFEDEDEFGNFISDKYQDIAADLLEDGDFPVDIDRDGCRYEPYSYD